jgi:hypothetical protein
MADEKRAARVDIGFSGGQVLSVRLQDAVYQELRKALDKGGDGWHELTTEDSGLALHLTQVVYVRVDTEQHKVGF